MDLFVRCLAVVPNSLHLSITNDLFYFFLSIAYEYFAELLRQKNLGNEGSNE